MTQFLTILADPPWQQPLSGKRIRKKGGMCPSLPYSTMRLDKIMRMPIGDFAADGCHLWLWTTNAFLEDGFKVMRGWGFKYLAPIVWVKPSGAGNYVIHRTQTLLLGYRGRCRFRRLRYFGNVMETSNPRYHSAKPDSFYDLIEQVSEPLRLEIFARDRRLGWESFGNEVPSTVAISTGN
jgi:N6-adenosine-specific RNA methylase IME4